MTGQRNQNIGGQKNANGNNTDTNLFTIIQHDGMKALVSKNFYCALLDSECTQEVCGETWYNCYKEKSNHR